jgi:signal transduction histidine kinase
MSTVAMLRASWRSWFNQDFRIVGPAWLQYVWTFVFCAIVAAGFTLLGFSVNARSLKGWTSPAAWWHWYQINLIVSLCVGYAIHLLFELSSRAIGVERLRRLGRGARVAYFILVPVTGVAIGWPLGVFLAIGEEALQWLSIERPGALIGSVSLTVLVCVAFYIFFAGKHREIQAENRATEARLKLLQGQIEPHFLFNTLANVIGLMEHDTPRAKAMLESFVDYLRSSLGSLRHDDHTLGNELALIEAYLRVVGMRMDTRLDWQIDVPEPLRRLPLLALSLQPLVENAVVHGLEPKIEGGRLRLHGHAGNGRLELSVEDDGLGLAAAAEARSNGAGTAIANIRERLLQRFGSQATLEVDGLSPHGVRSRLRIPLNMTQDDHCADRR